MPITYSDFTQQTLLNESLDSPVEFYMTDDTKMPREIYAAYTQDGVQYGMSLVLSEYNKVYLFDFYRIVNVKKRYWTFAKPAHIRSALSTIIKFMEMGYSHLQNKMSGVIIDLPGKTGSEQYVKLLGRVLKRGTLKIFKEVPITKTTNKAKNYLFMVRAGVEPAALFKTATFHKNFTFHKGEPQFTTDIVDQVDKQYYKKIKETVSIKPSEKYVFEKIKVELTAGDNLVNNLETAVEQHRLNRKIETTSSTTTSQPTLNVNDKGEREWKLNGKLHREDGPAVEMDDGTRFWLIHGKLHREDGPAVEMPNGKRYWYLNGEQLSESEYKKRVQNKRADTKLDIKEYPTSLVEGFESANNVTPRSGDLGFVEKDEKSELKKKSVLAMKEMSEWYNSFDPKKGGVAMRALYSYTGRSYYTYNGLLRDQVEKKKLSTSDLSGPLTALVKYFEKSPRLDNGIWVYRNTSTPNLDQYVVGDDYIDAAIMSTTITSSAEFAKDSNTRLRIYLPKGTRCFPIFGKSRHPHEDEIILPPFCMLKIIEIYENHPFPQRRLFTCVMVGDGVKDYLNQLQKPTITEQVKMVESDDEEITAEEKRQMRDNDVATSYEDAMRLKKLFLAARLLKKS